MSRGGLSSYLGLLFVVAVILPSIILVLIALRSINQEEASIEKSLEGTLLAEVTHVVGLINTEIASIGESLISSSPKVPENFPRDILLGWNERLSLVRIPFLLSSEFEVLWPDPDYDLSTEERRFLNWNRDFLRDRMAIPIYENIALAYKDEILNQVEDKLGSDQEKQQAIAQFEINRHIREQIYQQAEEKGEITERRNVSPSAKKSNKAENSIEQISIFIAQPRTFSEITSESDWGLFPLITDNRLTLIFWKKTPEGEILGCTIDERAFKGKLLDVLPNLFTDVRILTVLDERGVPIVTVPEERMPDLKSPFVAREISALLPRWEVAVYLSDPELVTSRATVVKTIIGTLIVILFVSIIAGGILVLRSLNSEMTLARQRTTFVANVSHELKTPLTSIRLFAEMLKERRQIDKKKQQVYLDTMVAECERLTRLINNVLDFSKIGRAGKQYNRQQVYVGRLCRDLIENQRIRLQQKDFQVKYRCNTERTIVYIDEEALKQALLNLLSNAEKYSGEKRIIDFEVYESEGIAVIDVMDRGVGIPMQHRKDIFKEFYRVNDELTSRVRGTGLGLTIARRLIRDHGGDIEYIPRPGGGSIFRLTLPLAESQPVGET
jgi:signal transduction histidine kinase